MNNKLEVLKESRGEDFVQIDAYNFKSSKADAIVLENDDDVAKFIKTTVKEEIPYLDNELLKRHLPEKFHHDFILDEYKELCKFGHTLLSNLIKDELLFAYDVMKVSNITDLVLMDSEVERVNDFWIFYLPHEQ